MKTRLLQFLCDPVDKSELHLENAVRDERGDVETGILVSASGRHYEIRDGVPRFVNSARMTEVASFGKEWNALGFAEFKQHWLEHTVRHTFGSPAIFRSKVIVDAGAGSGMQSAWMSELGAEYVIALELSPSVDGVMRKTVGALPNVDVVHCSIDQPPIKDHAIDGIVYCHNVIEFTPSVETTARALWRIVAPGGEFAFNCLRRNDRGIVRRLRNSYQLMLRAVLSRLPFPILMIYARVVALLRFVPVLGFILEKSGMVVRGDVPLGPRRTNRQYRAAVLNTVDWFGSQTFQHVKKDDEIRSLVRELQPDERKVLNADAYFSQPQPIGCALRILR